jgi:hexosaminidase
MKKTWLIFLVCCSLSYMYGQSVSVIPKPVESIINAGYPFTITKKTPFFFISGRCMANVIEFNSLLKKTYGFELGWTTEILDTNQQFIYLALPKDSTIPDEGYKMLVSSKYIKITATSRSGLFYALISVLQMMQPKPDGDGAFMVPACEIIDYPRFKWRGMHLDVCRHFFEKEFIKKYIDLLALHKMNTFHWHLTEDQGWRIEIKKYPLLTQIGAWRNGSMVGKYSDHTFDTIRYGGYYTQDDIREIVKYAASRHITIIPEIEMPGHALAALASYPDVSCNGGPFEVSKEWGVFDDVYCAGNEKTFQFIEDVLTEVCALFPGKYIHIGGDECPKERWKTCPKCQKRIREEGLKDEHELQSYFIRRVEKFLNSKGKQIIGWDEILEGGLAPNAAVMSWRGEQGGVDAANQKHEVVMSPGTHCYFDHYQGDASIEPLAIGGYTPVEKVYDYNPIPAGLTDSLAHYIMGAQGNVWTEYIKDEKQVEYMALPRMCALAEAVWTPLKEKSCPNFMLRLKNHFELLNRFNVNYSKSVYQVRFATFPMDNGVMLELFSNGGLGEIQYRFLGLDETPYNFPINGVVQNEIITTGDNSERIPLIAFNGIVEAWIKGSELRTKQYIETSKASSKSIQFKTAPHQKYNHDPEFTLVNGEKGSFPMRKNEWNAWLGEDVEITIDLQSVQEISSIEIGCLLDQTSWIWLPKEIWISASAKGKKYKALGVSKGIAMGFCRIDFKSNFDKTKARYIKINAKNPGKIPSGNPGAGEDCWMFFDEILID